MSFFFYFKEGTSLFEYCENMLKWKAQSQYPFGEIVMSQLRCRGMLRPVGNDQSEKTGLLERRGP